jgi:hypothetical protein
MTVEESQNRLRATNRNDPCPCGSGKKYKKCHRAEDEAAVHAMLAQQKAAAEAKALDAETQEDTEGKAGANPKHGSRGKGPKGRTQSRSTGKSREPNARASQLPRRGAV